MLRPPFLLVRIRSRAGRSGAAWGHDVAGNPAPRGQPPNRAGYGTELITYFSTPVRRRD